MKEGGVLCFVEEGVAFPLPTIQESFFVVIVVTYKVFIMLLYVSM